MNDFRTLNEEQLLALDYDQKQLIIDLECAQQGLPLLPENPGPKPEVAAVVPDSCVYEVAGVAVMTIEEANKILAFLDTFTLIHREYYGSNYCIKSVTADSYYAPKVTKTPTFTKEVLDSSKDMIKRNTQILAEWENHNTEYENAVTARKDVIEELEDLIENARNNFYKRESLRNKFQRYLTLAKDDRQIALNFLKAVESLYDFPELEEEFLNN
jgi:hypothetical protein